MEEDGSGGVQISPTVFQNAGDTFHRNGTGLAKHNLGLHPQLYQVEQSKNNDSSFVSAISRNSDLELRLAKKFNAVYELNHKLHLFSIKSLFCMG